MILEVIFFLSFMGNGLLDNIEIINLLKNVVDCEI